MEQLMSKPPTKGESRVRIQFNTAPPSAEKTKIDAIKKSTAELIDLCEEGIKEVKDKLWYDEAKAEAIRLWVLAQDAYEQAQMWAVKAATFKPAPK